MCVVISGQTFTNRTAELGIIDGQSPSINYGSGVNVVDLDGNGWDDLLLPRANDFLIWYRNNNGVFTRVPLFFVPYEVKSILVADYDNDGDKDMAVIPFNAPFKLFRNDGNMLFSDVSEASGIGFVPYPKGYGGSWGDVNNDGWLDLYVCSYAGTINSLFLSNGNGTFSEFAASLGLTNGSPFSLYAFQSVILDFNFDGRQDIFVINDRPPIDAFFLQTGPMQFQDVAAVTGFNHYVNSMSASVGDFNNDGEWDIYVTNTPGNGNFLYQKIGNSSYLNVASQTGVYLGLNSWGALWVDMDHDGWEDLYVSIQAAQTNSTNVIYRNLGGTFEPWMNFADEEPSSSYFSTAKGDFNRDGYYDIVASGTTLPVQVYINNGGSNHWLDVYLTGVESNRDGIGSWLEYWVNGQRRIRHTAAGENYLGQNAMHQLLSAGDADTIDSLAVHWPSGIVDRLYSMPVDFRLRITEGMFNNAEVNPEETLWLCPDGIVSASLQGPDQMFWSDGVTGVSRDFNAEGVYSGWAVNTQGWIEWITPYEVIFAEAGEFTAEISHPSCAGSSDGFVQVVSDYEWLSTQWSDGSDGLTLPDRGAGMYTFTGITTFGCEVIELIELIAPEELTAEAYAEHPTCFGGANGAIEVNAVTGGTPPYQISFLNNDESIEPFGLGEGQYYVMVTDTSACQWTQEIILAAPSELSVELTVGELSCEATVQGGTPPYMYFWNEDAGDSVSEDLLEGLNTVLVSDSLGCSVSAEFVWLPPVGVQEADTALPEWWLNSGLLHFSSSAGKVVLFDMSGRIVLTGRSPIDLRALSPGAYLWLIESGTSTRKARFIWQGR
jgi:hypothetical protein